MSSASDVLRALADAGAHASSKAPGDFGTALELGAIGLGFIADLVDEGLDPREVIPELRSHIPVVAKAKRSFRDAMERKFGADDVDTDPAPPPSAGIAHDPGDEDDG